MWLTGLLDTPAFETFIPGLLLQFTLIILLRSMDLQPERFGYQSTVRYVLMSSTLKFRLTI